MGQGFACWHISRHFVQTRQLRGKFCSGEQGTWPFFSNLSTFLLPFQMRQSRQNGPANKTAINSTVKIQSRISRGLHPEMAPKVESGCSRRPRNNISQQRPSQQSKKCGLIVSLWLPMLVIIIIIYSFFFNIFRLVVVSVWTFRKCGKIQLRPPARTKIFLAQLFSVSFSAFQLRGVSVLRVPTKKKKNPLRSAAQKKNQTAKRHFLAPFIGSDLRFKIQLFPTEMASS